MATTTERPSTTSLHREKSLSIVIPAYNEAGRIANTLREIHRYMTERRFDAELIVVDDGSRDGTLSVLREVSSSVPSLRILSYPANHGKGFAVRAGVLESGREAVLICDADLATPIAELEHLWPFLEKGAPIVIGSRYSPGCEHLVEQTRFRKYFARLSKLMISIIALRGIRDTQCGFKLILGSVARRLLAETRTVGFTFDVDVLRRARMHGWSIKEVPVRWKAIPGSKVRPVKDAISSILELLRMTGIL